MSLPQFVQHRVNTVAGLDQADTQGGVEIDLRTRVEAPGELHLSHDPWVRGENFSTWLAAYAARKFRGPLVLNTKEDGLEMRISALMAHHGITAYFFLDTTPPTLRACLLQDMGPHMSVRLSQVEPLEALKPWYNLQTGTRKVCGPGWIWADCFDGVALTQEIFVAATRHAKVCLVSPELQKVPLHIAGPFAQLGKMTDALCTKHPKTWRQALTLPCGSDAPRI